MNRYRIIGATRKTGADIQMDVDARSEAEAESVAVDRGIVVSEVVTLATSRDTAKRVESYGVGAARVLVKWNLKILLYIAILVAPILVYTVVQVLLMR